MGQVKADRVRVDLAHANRLSADDQEIALRRVDFLVEIEIEAEDYVVGVERLAIRKAQAPAKMQRVLPAVRSGSPGFGEGGFSLLRGAVDIDKAGGKAANHVTRSCILGQDRVQGLGLRAQRHDNLAARVPGSIVRHHRLLRRLLARRCCEGSRRRKRTGANKYQCEREKAPVRTEFPHS